MFPNAPPPVTPAMFPNVYVRKNINLTPHRGF